MKRQNRTGFEENKEIHKPVLVSEVIAYFEFEKDAHLKKEKRYIDATVGAGGHSKELVKRGAKVLGIDSDASMLDFARVELEKACPDRYQKVPVPVPTPCRDLFKLVAGNFKDIDKIAREAGFSEVDGILFDLGISSYQLDISSRGFSFQHIDVPLDMRTDEQSSRVTAADLINALGEGELVKMFSVSMDYHESRRLAKSVVNFRKTKKVESVGDFVEIIDATFQKRRKINSATLPFMAVRIAVNTELENLKLSLPRAAKLLRIGGKMIVISFHSKEDKIVKDFYKAMKNKGMAKVLTKKPIIPKRVEIKSNPRSRSAKMRVLEKR